MQLLNRQKYSKSNSYFLNLCAAVSALVLIQGVFTAPVAQAQSAPTPSISGSANNTGVLELGDAFMAPGSVDQQQTRLIFYRNSNSSFKGGASIYFNGMYHATLARSAYSVLCVTPDRAVNLGVKPVTVGSPVKDNFDSISLIELQGGRNQYVRVIEDRHIKVLQPVSEAVALVELTGTREQIHTLSRVKTAKVCRSAVAVTPPPSEHLQTITLTADDLFNFAGSERKALGVKGRAALDNLITHIQADYSIINQLDVFGHAAPIGSEQQSDRLSFEQAQTVKNYLQENGLQSTPITAQGRGASALVVNTCGRTATAANIACNSPNRRVTLEIRGTRR